MLRSYKLILVTANSPFVFEHVFFQNKNVHFNVLVALQPGVIGLDSFLKTKSLNQILKQIKAEEITLMRIRRKFFCHCSDEADGVCTNFFPRSC